MSAYSGCQVRWYTGQKILRIGFRDIFYDRGVHEACTLFASLDDVASQPLNGMWLGGTNGFSLGQTLNPKLPKP